MQFKNAFIKWFICDKFSYHEKESQKEQSFRFEQVSRALVGLGFDWNILGLKYCPHWFQMNRQLWWFWTWSYCWDCGGKDGTRSEAIQIQNDPSLWNGAAIGWKSATSKPVHSNEWPLTKSLPSFILLMLSNPYGDSIELKPEIKVFKQYYGPTIHEVSDKYCYLTRLRFILLSGW